MAGNVQAPLLTKIVATMGPAIADAGTIDRLIELGVAVFRLNFSHGDLATHESWLRLVRQCAEKRNQPIAVLGDLQGPKIRVGDVVAGGVRVEAGSSVVFQRQPMTATPEAAPPRFSSTYGKLVDDVAVGHRVLVEDGAIRMLVVEKRPDEFTATVTYGGAIQSHKGINLPDSKLSLQLLSSRDLECIDWAVRNGLDFLALSFVRTHEDIREVAAQVDLARRRHNLANLRMPIVAKIERPEAVDHIESIVEAADAIMVARGDLGVEMDLARVPIIQKRLLAACKAEGKPCIVATQMLQSMIEASTPTRAEASDVANALLDGADAVMLSGETSVGRYPILAVEAMRRIALTTETYQSEQPVSDVAPRKLMERAHRTAALAHGAWHIANDIRARFIVVWSQQGGGARYLSRHAFRIPIIAISSDDRALRQMQLLRGVIPVRMPVPESPAHFTRLVDAYLLETGWCEGNEPCLILAGGPIGRTGATNALAIHFVGSPDTGFARMDVDDPALAGRM
jgi:pyruvate kinase